MNLIYFYSINIYILSIDTYALYRLSKNLDNFINGYISFNTNFANNSLHDLSIKNIMFNLKIINSIAIFSLVALISQVFVEFRTNQKINKIFFWLTLFIFTLTLAYLGYAYGDFHAHLGSYVNAYINIRNK